jgi:prepilin-type N-terminal cleavage/methylation domain-containing protein
VKGFTLVEMMVVLVVAAIVVAIAYPVFSTAKLSAKETVSVSNMRQLHTAIELYRQDYQGSIYGTVEAMGLPPELLNLPKSVQLRPPLAPPNFGYYYNPVETKFDHRHPTWAQYTEREGEKAVLLMDFWFTPGILALKPQYYMDANRSLKRMGITLGGKILRKTGSGGLDLDWWDR